MKITKQLIEDLIYNRQSIDALIEGRRIRSGYSSDFAETLDNVKRFIGNYDVMVSQYENFPDIIERKVFVDLRDDLRLLIEYSSPKADIVDTLIDEDGVQVTLRDSVEKAVWFTQDGRSVKVSKSLAAKIADVLQSLEEE